jgi:hypothetical protein
MPNTKKSSKTTTGRSTTNVQNTGKKNPGKGHGMTSGEMPHIPTARERAKDMDSSRRSNAQTFEL